MRQLKWPRNWDGCQSTNSEDGSVYGSYFVHVKLPCCSRNADKIFSNMVETRALFKNVEQNSREIVEEECTIHRSSLRSPVRSWSLAQTPSHDDVVIASSHDHWSYSSSQCSSVGRAQVS